MLRHDYTGQHCSIAASLEIVGERWSLLIIRDILLGRRRFGQMQESLGIARNVLTTRLRRLTESGLIEARPYQEKPIRNEYFLTEKGLDLWPVLVSLIHWGDKHYPHAGDPPIMLVHRDCGGAIDDRRICRSCGEPLEARDAIALSGHEAREMSARRGQVKAPPTTGAARKAGLALTAGSAEPDS